MKTYREQYNDLHFSPEEKQAMVESLLAAAPETRRRVSHKKRVHVLIAAVIAAALCAACASGRQLHPGRPDDYGRRDPGR